MMKACQRMAIHPTMAIGGAEVQPKNATAAARVFCSQTKPEILAAIDVKTSFGDKIKGTGKVMTDTLRKNSRNARAPKVHFTDNNRGILLLMRWEGFF